MHSKLLEVKVWADFGSFTRPESKVERVSYEVMTPSAARGVLEAILWKPQFTWRIHEIAVLNPIKRMSILRNEINDVASVRTARSWQSKGGGYRADENRAQRHSLILRDVAYVVRAEIIMKSFAVDPAEKYCSMFTRRIKKGQARHQPYLGNREFTAFFSPVDGSEQPIDHSEDLGRMLLDMQFTADAKGNILFTSHAREGDHIVAEQIRGFARPTFFNARLEKGVMAVPAMPPAEVG